MHLKIAHSCTVNDIADLIIIIIIISTTIIIIVFFFYNEFSNDSMFNKNYFFSIKISLKYSYSFLEFSSRQDRFINQRLSSRQDLFFSFHVGV